MSKSQNNSCNQEIVNYFYRASAKDFMKVPGNPIAYWLSFNISNLFKTSKTLEEYSDIRTGMQTGDNEKFLRLWPEVSTNFIKEGLKNSISNIQKSTS